MLRQGNARARRSPGPVAQSVIDRLINPNPKAKTEAPQAVSESVRQFKDGLRRDLDWLLNTRSIAIRPSDSFRELNRSVYVYGFPDLASFSMANPKDRERLQRAIQGVIRLFEPRIDKARVVLVDPAESTHKLTFRIEGQLRIEPAEPVSYVAELSLSSGSYKVKGESNA